MTSQQSMQRRLCVQHRHQSLGHKYVSRRNELRAEAVAPCLQPFSSSCDECAAALPYETSPCFIELSCLPCDESARPSSEHLCPCTAPADKSGECRLQLVPPTFCPRPGS